MAPNDLVDLFLPQSQKNCGTERVHTLLSELVTNDCQR